MTQRPILLRRRSRKAGFSDQEPMRSFRIPIALSLMALLGGCASMDAMRRVNVDFEYVSEQAEERARKSYREPRELPAALSALDYDEYRKIVFKRDSELWRNEGLPFAASFFHRGYIHDNAVSINEFTATHAQGIRYLPTLFEFGGELQPDDFSGDLGYAGLRLSAALGDTEEYHEIASFLGASYFRAVGQGAHYGSSARGIAIDSGLSEPEEFPRFVEFWLGKPLGNAHRVVVYALLDGPSVTGAYEFVIKPGSQVEMQVKARLFLREDVKSFGIAPLTSMFWRGENSRSAERDYRPEVHDADGLLLKGEDGYVWRPLDIADKTRLSYFRTEGFEGFGLMQRDRDFANYQDLEAEYHLRPSVWVEAKNDWGSGYVKLVELPTSDEFHDNVVAYWEPSVLPGKGDALDLEYVLRWTDASAPDGAPQSQVIASRLGDDLSYPGTSVFVLDFTGSEEQGEPEVVASMGGSEENLETRLQWNPYAKAWRVTLRVSEGPSEGQALELACQLLFPEGEKSETWAYQWTR